jgi:hypothetical protein
MRVGGGAVLGIIFAVVGCSSNSSDHRDQRWLLVAATPTREYPVGQISAPVERWPRVTEYASLDECADSLWGVSNELQLPVQCVASDDPRIKNEPQVAAVSITRADHPAQTRMLAVRQLPAF